MAFDRRDFLKIATAGSAATLAMQRKAPAQGGKFPKKVIILGFDGASPIFVEKWMAAGLLPNLAKLRAQGSYERIETANPPQTPVSWASFATGMNPGKTGLFDFLKRDLSEPGEQAYWPKLALVEQGKADFLAGEKNPLVIGAGAFAVGGVAGLAVKALYNVIRRRMNPEKLMKLFDPKVLAAVAGFGALAGGGAYAFSQKYLPDKIPTVKNGVKGRTFWQFLDDRSIPTASFRVPVRFPADDLKHGRAVAGLGTPDVRGTTCSYTYYTTELLPSDEIGDTEMGGIVVPLYFKPTTQETMTVVHGPRDTLFPENTRQGESPAHLTCDLHLKEEPTGLFIRTEHWSGRLKPGEWSEPVIFTFRYNKAIKFDAFARFHLLEISPDVKLFMTPLSFHPKTPLVRWGPIKMSTPRSLAGELSDRHGLVKNYGWVAETHALNENRLPEESFMADVRNYVESYRAMMHEFLKSDEPLFVDVYSFTDRVGHMFWHHFDTAHPLHDPAKAAKGQAIMLEAYQLMDSIVGDVMKTLDENKRLFVISDHGFQPFRRSVNYNTWLAKNGLLASELGDPDDLMKLEDLFGPQAKGRFWPHVDWSKTKAYAFGLGGIYINLKGRENFGSVEPGEEYEQVRRQIIEGMQDYVDPETGERPVFKVYTREESYVGYDPDEMPDLRAANSSGYRCSWQSSLCAIPPEIINMNAKRWSGDHCSYEPSITKGIFFSSQKVARNNPNLLDFFPTVLELFGYDVPGDRDGKSLI